MNDHKTWSDVAHAAVSWLIVCAILTTIVLLVKL